MKHNDSRKYQPVMPHLPQGVSMTSGLAHFTGRKRGLISRMRRLPMTWSLPRAASSHTSHTSCLGEITGCKRNTLLSTDWNCALSFHPTLVPKSNVCNSSLYHKCYAEEKRLLCCACLMLGDKAHKEKANVLLQ